jgi:hypothetical protein
MLPDAIDKPSKSAHLQGEIAGAGSGRKSATEPIPALEPNIPAMAYRIEESWPLGREPVWRQSLARVASRVGAAVAGLAAGGGELRGSGERTAA